MNTPDPDPPGFGTIFITQSPDGTAIYCSQMPIYLLAHLFYYALKEIPDAPLAAKLALDRYNKESANN